MGPVAPHSGQCTASVRLSSSISTISSPLHAQNGQSSARTPAGVLCGDVIAVRCVTFSALSCLLARAYLARAKPWRPKVCGVGEARQYATSRASAASTHCRAARHRLATAMASLRHAPNPHTCPSSTTESAPCADSKRRWRAPDRCSAIADLGRRIPCTGQRA